MNFRLKPYIQTFFGCLLVAGSLAVSAAILTKPNVACAQATTPCDPEYMDALEARAWLEAQREISQNQNLIVKPDSVLEYVCFDQFLDVLAEQAASMFSETTRWGPIDGLGPTSQDTALQTLVSAGLVAYLTANFQHNYIGGRMNTEPRTVNSAPGNRPYNCSVMREVWEAAKCMNFFDEREFDGFYDFQWYATQMDPRRYPMSMAVCERPNQAPFTYETMQQVAFNQRQETYVLQEENPNDNTQYNVDNLVTFLNFILPRGVGPAEDCQGPIQTGVRVQRRLMTQPYDDGVCPNPGCYFQVSGGSGTCSSGGTTP